MKAEVLLYFFTQLAGLSGYTVGAPSVGDIMVRRMTDRHAGEELIRDVVSSSFLKVVEAMEIMLIAVVSPVIRCEWQLENWQVALVTTVSACFWCFDQGFGSPFPIPQG